jgi:hypothetical protein
MTGLVNQMNMNYLHLKPSLNKRGQAKKANVGHNVLNSKAIITDAAMLV